MKRRFAIVLSCLLIAEAASGLILGLQPGHYHLTGRLNYKNGQWQLELNPDSSASFILILTNRKKFPVGMERLALNRKLVSVDMKLDQSCLNYCLVRNHEAPEVLLHQKDLKTYSGDLSPKL
jgi:hypothetical protein